MTVLKTGCWCLWLLGIYGSLGDAGLFTFDWWLLIDWMLGHCSWEISPSCHFHHHCKSALCCHTLRPFEIAPYCHFCHHCESALYCDTHVVMPVFPVRLPLVMSVIPVRLPHVVMCVIPVWLPHVAMSVVIVRLPHIAVSVVSVRLPHVATYVVTVRLPHVAVSVVTVRLPCLLSLWDCPMLPCLWSLWDCPILWCLSSLWDCPILLCLSFLWDCPMLLCLLSMQGAVPASWPSCLVHLLFTVSSTCSLPFNHLFLLLFFCYAPSVFASQAHSKCSHVLVIVTIHYVDFMWMNLPVACCFWWAHCPDLLRYFHAY